MKKTFSKQAFLLVLVIFLSPVWALAQTLHVFVVAETSDRTIGASKDFVRMQQYANKIANMSGMTLNLKTFEKHNTSATQLINAINNLRVGNDDTVWFYFTGHGFNVSGSHFSGFPLSGKEFSMDKIHSKFKAKNPRLLITMYDACNWHSNGGSQLVAGMQDDGEKFAKLFKKSRGEIKIASNTAGNNKYSYGNAERGGFFTTSFLNTINEAMENWTLAEVTWEKILQTTKNKTAQLARNRNREQVPYYTCSVRTSGREPVYDPTPAPKPKELDNDW